MRTKLYAALLTALFLAVWSVPASQAAGPDYQGFGLPGPLSSTQIQLDELRVTYRFDQMGQRGKAQDAVPVQATYKFHNPGPTQTLEVGVPLPSANGKTAELTSVFVNGKEVRPAQIKNVNFVNSDSGVRAAVISVTVFENSDLILDLRGNQPVEKLEFPFDMRTGAGWDGTVQSGTYEAILPYDAANWNLALRKRGDDTLVPLNYAGRAATWTFTELKPEAANDVYWTIADPSAMDYYSRGNLRYQQTQGDAESYSMMRSALLDMVPCGDVKMPLSTWWNSVYDTVSTGYLAAQYPEGMERLSRSLELWSDSWNVPHGDDAACQTMRQRPDRYRQALKALLAIPKDQLSAQANTALANHYRFLRNLAAANSPESRLSSGDTDPIKDPNLSEADKSVMSQWDDRFASTTAVQQQGNASSTPIGNFWNKIKAAFPKLSLRTQIAIFVILALLVLIGVALIAFGWKEKEEPQWRGQKPDDGKLDRSVFKPGPPAKPLYDRPQSISGANFAKPEPEKKLDDAYVEPQSGLGMGFKKPEHPAVPVAPKPIVGATPPKAPSVETPKPQSHASDVAKAPVPPIPPPIGTPHKAATGKTDAPLFSISNNMPWEQPVKLEPVAKPKDVPSPTKGAVAQNTASNTKPDQHEHKNGPTVKI